ncbi:MAG: YegP family protein [Nocardioidaceae bacterium]
MAEKFELFKGKAGKYRFRLKADNGDVLAVSDGYDNKQEAQQALNALKNKASGAEVVDLVKE